MSISIVKYVDINSVVGGGNQVPTRNYGAMVISSSTLIPTGKIAQFTSAANVGTYFGTGSGEYKRAVFYFGWISKTGNAPQLLSFWNWNANAATPDYLFGGTPIDSLSAFNAFTGGNTGELLLTMGGFTHTLTGIDLVAAGSLAAVATDIQTAINSYSAGGSAWTAATVAYNSTTGTFNLVSGTTGLDVIAVAAAAAHDLAGPLGWLASNAILSNGTAAQTLTANLTQLAALSNNFGSFCFGASAFNTLINAEAAAAWNLALTPNVQFMFTVATTVANAATWAAGLANYGGTTITLAPTTGETNAPATTEYPEMVPMMIFAATNYNQPNSVQNYKYQEFNLTPSVTSDADYATYTALKINFYGQTQTAGQLISFYQNGYMLGLEADPGFQNLYANEIWFKDNLTAALLNLLLSLTQVPANSSGAALIAAQMQSVISVALNNGTISKGKQLSSTQILYIGQVTASSTAWYQVQTQGYWFDVVIVLTGSTYTAEYTLVYSKDDVVQSITGSNILI